jgi:hypothetical protein
MSDGSFCHCSKCRKLTGSAVAAYGAVNKSDFVWVKGERNLTHYVSGTNSSRKFCRKCGAFLLSEHLLEPDFLFIYLGSLDSDDELDIEYHQYVGSKARWYMIDDNLVKYQAWPDIET